MTGEQSGSYGVYTQRPFAGHEDGSNDPALSLYRSIGFRAIGDDHDWVRELGARPRSLEA